MEQISLDMCSLTVENDALATVQNGGAPPVVNRATLEGLPRIRSEDVIIGD